MKKIFLRVTLALAISVTSMTTVADNTDKSYARVQYAAASYDVDNLGEANPTVLVGGFGKYFGSIFALEGRLGLGLEDDTIATNRSVVIDNLLGIYGVGHFNLGETSSLYGLIGYTRATVTNSVAGFQAASIYDSGLSLGAGADIGISKNVALNVEYIQYLDSSTYNFSAISLGAVFSF